MARLTDPRPQRPAVQFSPEELAKIRHCTMVLGISYPEFIHRATMQAVDEVLSDEGP